MVFQLNDYDSDWVRLISLDSPIQMEIDERCICPDVIRLKLLIDLIKLEVARVKSHPTIVVLI